MGPIACLDVSVENNLSLLWGFELQSAHPGFLHLSNLTNIFWEQYLNKHSQNNCRFTMLLLNNANLIQIMLHNKQSCLHLIARKRSEKCTIFLFPPSIFHAHILNITLWMFRNEIGFYGEEKLAHRPTPKLEDHPLSAVHDCLFNTFAATLHHIGGSS
jgi:hypothetical protein